MADLTKTLTALESLADTEWNKQLKAQIEEKIKMLQAEQAKPETASAKQKALGDLLNIKKMAERHVFPVHKDHDAQI